MKKHARLFIAMLAVMLSAHAWGQMTTVELNAANNGRTTDVSNLAVTIADDGGTANNYTAGGDFNHAVTATCTETDHRLRLWLLNYDIAPTDTLFLYDGATTSSPRLAVINNNMPPASAYFYPSTLNASGTILVRFKTAANSECGEGFNIQASCALPCVETYPQMAPRYFKARNGIVYDSMEMGDRWQKDTLWDVNVYFNEDSVLVRDTLGFDTIHTHFFGLELCEGDSIILECRGDYGDGIYTPSDRTTKFLYEWGDGLTTDETGLIFGGHTFASVGCYDLTVLLTDYIGCVSLGRAEVRVRVAQNPYKTLFELPNICNVDSFLVNVGYEGEGAFLSLRQIEFQKTATKTNPIRTFIPDGQWCADPCYSAPVTFVEFPIGKTVSSKDDICSICLNYEHSFMGDYRLSVQCPNGSEAIIKYGSSMSGMDPLCPTNNNYSYGGGRYTGFPVEDGGWDATGVAEQICDSLNNPFGDGLEYCWSRKGEYTLVTDEPADCGTEDYVYVNPADPNGRRLASNGWTVNRHIAGGNAVSFLHTYTPVPAYFQVHAGDVYGTDKSVSTTKPSNHEMKADYYLPDADFSELVGCPLNGTWNFKVCDYYKIDNGWVFSWSMDICGISSGGCEYQVGVDSVVWIPDSAYGDFDLGHWRGAVVHNVTNTNSWISTPDTAGYFPILISVYDEFGCRWDTTTSVRSVWTPMPDLADTVNLCGVETLEIDATDAHTAFTNQTFAWEPYGDTTGIITTRPLQGETGSYLYLVEVTNTEHNLRCSARDSVRVSFFRTPVPAFDQGIYPAEGCEPFTMKFTNQSLYGDKYLWVFGDGATSTAESPVHTYAAGQYGFKYYITSADGCKDSVVYDQHITVFPSPIAKFSWEPINPTVLHPEVHFINKTEPMTDDVKFYWEVQYDRDNSISYHTMTDINPTFEWTTDGEDISGTYIARLIAKTDERGPSGHTLECRDTVENTILLVNDFLQFPNVITANGDGVNDRFEIKNLVNGLGYPNNSLTIYNRWGKRVYHKVNISSEDDFWDPAKENIPSGTYFWRFSGKGYLGDIERNGTVEVLR